MKLMYCQDCGALVVPGRDMEPKWCECGRHAVWWRDGVKGLISFYDRHGSQQRVFLIGINNALLRADDLFDAKAYRTLATECGPSYLFHAYESNIIRAKPGCTNDSRWESTLPGEAAREGR